MKAIAPLSLIAAALIAAPLWAQEAKPEAPKQIQPVPTAEKEPPAKKEKEAKKGLAVGDDAPAFKVETFIKGEPVKSFEKGKVYVVEFWATWCGPCIRAFPHLSELQAKHKDKVVIIGTNIWERSYNDETLEKIKEFVAKQGDKMAYTVAYDGAARAMDNAYMKAAGQDGIPSAFIVNQEGKIAWIGHPAEIDKVLEKVIAGKYDSTSAAKIAELNKKAEKAARAEKWDDAVAAIDEIIKLDAEHKGRALYTKYQLLFNGKNDYTAAYAMKDALLAEKEITENGQLLNEIAWRIVDPEGDVAKKDRNLDFAMAFANKANEATKGEDGMIIDTVARVYWEKGDRAKAIELQEKAVKAAENDKKVPENVKDEMKSTLETYKKENAKGGA